MAVKKTGIRVLRKSAHLSHRVLAKGANFSAKVEDKTTRIITGKDFSVRLGPSIPVEKAVFNGLAYNVAPLNPALPAVGRRGKVTILIPSLNKRSFFGGTATALILAGRLALELGRPLRIVETLEPGGKAGLGDFLESSGIHLPEEVELIDVSARTYNRYGYLDLHPDDVLIASAWWDAHLLGKLPLINKFIYLIQDFEPIFYPNSDEYVFAETTYHDTNYIPVCNTKLMYDFMVSEGYDYIKDNGLWFEPAVSQQKKGFSVENTSGKRQLFLYGRPSVARNLFYTALEALNTVFNDGTLDPNKWELFMAGQDKIPDIKLSTGIAIHNLGKLSMEEYTEFMRTVDVAVSPMMAPHPNYPTLEFASVGAAVVTTKYKTKQDLSNYSKNILMADLSAKSIADTIVAASKLSYENRIANARTANILSSWDGNLAEVLATIAKKLT
jgi:hypothetical protein